MLSIPNIVNDTIEIYYTDINQMYKPTKFSKLPLNIKEFKVGLKVNKLCNYTPNFLYTYGISDYILIEHSPYPTMSQLLNDNDDVVNWYLQILLSLYQGRIINYTNYNLHTDNILIKKLNKKVSIPYIYRDNTLYINTDTIPIIYRHQYAYVDGIYNIEDESLGIYNKHFPLSDAFKLIYHMMHDMKDTSKINWIYNYFSSYDTESDFIRYTDESLTKLIDYILSKVTIYNIPQYDIYHSLGIVHDLEDNIHIEDECMYYDLIYSLRQTNRQNTVIYNKVKNSFKITDTKITVPDITLISNDTYDIFECSVMMFINDYIKVIDSVRKAMRLDYILYTNHLNNLIEVVYRVNKEVDKLHKLKIINCNPNLYPLYCIDWNIILPIPI
jgi:hypothetical protein